eukprot:CAMPEP_0196805512 /NCGR_PEP_ID=MMETSP1362-20130617/5303_1 /TAXON_ID=163516 /ORGANISM="Leptocylindrus danicus, Strain CCMP1856" /LENGTH=61 /DNA_ID=CAMNT_0042178501 /DNA_START=92 /DNA_END=277 /DNA_ORIENTATION=-
MTPTKTTETTSRSKGMVRGAKKIIPGATSEECPLQEGHNESDDGNDQHMATTATNIETTYT